MASKQTKSLPRYINLDTNYENLLPDESPFIKNYTFDINANGQLNTGTGNPSGEGQNEYILTPARSNKKIPHVKLPNGYNKQVGGGECLNTKEYYYFNYNNKGKHSIHVISGDNMAWTQVIEDANLNFSDEPDAYIAEHRIRLRVKYDANRSITEKYLIWTDGKKWHGWVSVIAAIKTNGFDASLNDYWTLKQPHFDRNELLEYPVRPPMSIPEISLIANTDDFTDKPNRLINTSFQFCYQNINTDGRETTVSPLSLPLIVKTEDFLSNPDLIDKRALIKMSAGSPLTEKINLYYRFSVVKKGEYGGKFIVWGNWLLYDTIYKFTNDGENSFDLIGDEYWLRKNPYTSNNYDPVFNTIEYVFDNSRLGQITDQKLFSMVETAMPQLSVGLSDLGDAIMLANNRHGYDNLSDELLGKISASVKNKDVAICARLLRKITVYAYLGARIGQDYYYSNVGYYYGEDSTMRFGGMSVGFDTPNVCNIDLNESKTFDLTFGGRDALRLYAKGTQYYTDGVWYQVNNDLSKVKIESKLDGSNEDTRQYILNTWENGGFFVCQFELDVPAGIYNLTLGRHNVESSSDWRNTSTYIMGIADSTIRTIAAGSIITVKPNAIKTFSKEMEIDCTNGNVDTWGNGQDLFYVYVPSVNSTFGTKNWKFIEGYLYQQQGRTIGVELFPYQLVNGGGTDDSGQYTDKNGFYFAYSKHNRSPNANIEFTYKLNCGYPYNFTLNGGADNSGWFKLPYAYLSDHNRGVVGFGNYVVLKISIKNVAGTIGYSNIGVSIKDGATTYTNSNGDATLFIHNGQNNNRISNVYVNAGGNFTISLPDCGQIPVFNYDENNIFCQTTTERIYPYPLNLNINTQSGEATSLKSNAEYIVNIVCADLAGRRTFANRIEQLSVPSFVQAGTVAATYMQWALNGGLGLQLTDMKWVSFYCTLAIDYQRYIQWVGDKIEYIDISGNVTTNTASAVFVRITINSLLNANIKQNFTLLANYQFVQGDRLRVLDDGDGNLFNTSLYGSLLDVEVQGSDYNQAAINANLVLPPTSIVLNTDTSDENTATILVKYDSRFDKLKDKTSFWIELYTPDKINDKTPCYQASTWFPIVNGDLAVFNGYDSAGKPSYNYPKTGFLDFWDTYLINRNIQSGTTSKNLGHPFESPNATDTWGANLHSGGSITIENADAKQMWYQDSIIKSDEYITEGQKNGLGTFRESNKKSFEGYWWGGIVMVKAINSFVFFLCENDYFTTDYNYHYAYPNERGVMVVNLDAGISLPHQKIDYIYGCDYNDTSTIFTDDRMIGWHDQKNSGYILSDLQSAIDITQLQQGDRRAGIKSYYSAKCSFIAKWNLNHNTKNRFDVVTGLDMQTNSLYITFRPRRNNSTAIGSFINNKRNIHTDANETFVYNLDIKRWTPMKAFTPEGYGKLRGALGNEMISFANGIPYYHINTGNRSFCEFYGVETERVLMIVLNTDLYVEKVLQSVSLDSNSMAMICDYIYSNQPNSYSYIPMNYFLKKGNQWYAPALRDANSYPKKSEQFRNMLLDGKRIFGVYTILRFIGDAEKLTEYQELNSIYLKYLPLMQTAVK